MTDSNDNRPSIRVLAQANSPHSSIRSHVRTSAPCGQTIIDRFSFSSNAPSAIGSLSFSNSRYDYNSIFALYAAGRRSVSSVTKPS